MATFVSNFGIDYLNLDISQTLNATDSGIENNIYGTFNGKVYEDVVWTEYDFGWSYMYFGGQGITSNGRDITGGTVTGILQESWTGSKWVVDWALEGVNARAVNIWNAANTGSTADDSDLMRLMLSTADTINDRLYGFGGNDIIRGDAGNDLLVGGLGRDVLIGDAGADRFAFASSAETGPTARDVITDFRRTEDVVDLRGIDANSGVGGNQAFSNFIGASQSFTKAGQLKFVNGVLFS